MSWNHRVIKRTYDTGETEFGIHEHYTEDDNPYITESPVAVVEDSVEELRQTLQRMLAALDKPVLNYEDF